MASTIVLKNSATASATPTTGDLTVQGEVAINLTDKRIYARNDANAIIELGASQWSVIAGSGLTGGGQLTADRTINIGAGTGITVNADDVALDTSSTRNTDHASITLTAGTGLTGGGTIDDNRSFALDTTYTDNRYLAKNSETNVVTDTTDTLADADEGTDIVYTSASAVTVTIPGTLEVGFQCTITQAGAGAVTLTSTDNLNGASADLTTNSQWKTVYLLQYSEGNWLVAGDVS